MFDYIKVTYMYHYHILGMIANKGMKDEKLQIAIAIANSYELPLE